MKKLVVLAVLILALSASMAMASPPVNWSTAVVGEVVFNVNPIDAEPSGLISGTDAFNLGIFTTQSGATQDFTGFPNSQLVGSSNILGFPVSAYSPVGWQLKDAASGTIFGTWYTESGVHQHTNVLGADYVNIELLGYFDPGTYSGFTGKTLNTGALSLTFTQSATGGLVGGGGRMKMDPVPEASTLVGFGSALAMAGPGLLGWLRRRRA